MSSFEHVAANMPTLADLSDLALIRVSGEDARDFLHSQFCNDVKKLDSTQAQLNGYCSPKGRLLASFLLWQHGDDYLLQLPSELRESIQKRLTMFVLRSKVKLTDASADFVRLGLSGPQAGNLLHEFFGPVPEARFELMHGEQARIIRLGDDRFDLLVDAEDALAITRRLAGRCTAVSSQHWLWLDIRAGIPTITRATQEQFVPQMVNFELLGGVNFQKGCYPGQEIVARTQYLGRLKRRMYLAHIAAENVAAGDSLFSADLEGQASGTIVNAARAPSGGQDVLAVIQIDSAQQQTIHWKTADGPQLQLQTLPYPVP
jgi:tRNA-modifying protein YgfZ